ncbi:hypothetical protein ACI8AK_05270 [Geodermatophilus sp. SYSU D00867]
MPDPLRLNFRGWARSGIYAVVSGTALDDGRLTGRIGMTLRNQEPPHDEAEEEISFDVLGPGDVLGLKPGALGQCMPAPGTPDFAETKCAYVELSAADLPWRYTPELATLEQLRPWLALVTAKPGAGEVALSSGSTVTLAGEALATHDLARSARWAHVQEDADRPDAARARLLSPRNLDPETEYLAVVVPAFRPDGQPSWTTGTASVTLPAYHWWSFRTAEEGDFPTLAARLQATEADPTLGRAPLVYTPVPDGPELSARGALAPIGGTDAALPPAVAADVQVLTTRVVDPRRPVVGLPVYGDAWLADPASTQWGAVFRQDPRSRTVAGLGLGIGIDEQDLLADAAAAQAGALAAAAQRVRNLVAGLGAARGLWTRRLPVDPLRRLVVFGPALGRIMTPSGTVLGRATADGRPLPAALFSSAARRALRPGPNRTALATSGAADPRAVIVAANACPPPPERAPKGLPHTDDIADRTGVEPLDTAVEQGVQGGGPRFQALQELIERFDRRPYSDRIIDLFDSIMRQVLDRARQGGRLQTLVLLAILDSPTGKQPDEERLLELLRRLDSEPDSDSLLHVARPLLTREPVRPCDPVDLDVLTEGVAAAIDPTGDRPFVADRVLGGITGLDDQPLTPPELCPDLDIPAWQLLRDHAPDWLLPGAQQLADNAVVAVETNPAFVDAFLLGLNSQTLGELRFRNIPVRHGCTPLRQFWSRTDPAAGFYVDDIVGVHAWPAASDLGSTAHQTPAAASADLVVVFKTPLFRRYPATLVYLTPARLVGGEPDWAADPDFDSRLLPSFQGSVTPNITFFGFDLDPALGAAHWVVLEEPPQGFQFFNTARQPDGAPLPGFDAARIARYDGALHGGSFADAAFADPYRVLIRGEALIPEPS